MPLSPLAASGEAQAPSALKGPFPPASHPLPTGATPTRALFPFVPQISLAERDRRWGALRSKMKESGLEALVFLGTDIFWGMGMANLRYILQVDCATGAEALFPADGDPVVWSGSPHVNRPTNMFYSVQDWVGDHRSRAGLGAVAEELRARGLDRSRVGLVGYSSAIQTTSTLLHAQVIELEEKLPGAVLTDAGNLLEELRMIKSEEEIRLLGAGAAIARRALDALVESARPGVTEAAVYAEMLKAQVSAGAEPQVFNLFTAGPVEHPATDLWHTLHGTEQQMLPTQRPLEEGDVVLAEWHTRYAGYLCHTEYTVYLGKRAPVQLLRLWDVAVECLEASKNALVAGRTLREAWEMIRKPAKQAGVDWVELGFHGHGLGSPEFPSVAYEEGYGSNHMNGDGIGEFVLQEGMTFGNNIDLHDSGWKVDVGCMLADLMVVRPTQAQCLVQPPLEFAQVS